jgi:mRNA interferase MazF
MMGNRPGIFRIRRKESVYRQFNQIPPGLSTPQFGGSGPTATLHPKWRSRLQITCAGKEAEIAVDQIRTISKKRLRQKIDQLPATQASQLRRIITEMYGE